MEKYSYYQMRNTTYGFDLTPLLLLAWSMGDHEWLEMLHRRYMKDREMFPSFYQGKGTITYLEG